MALTDEEEAQVAERLKALEERLAQMSDLVDELLAAVKEVAPTD